MTITENIYSAKTHLSKLIARVLKGDEVVIAKAGTPLVCIVPYHARHPQARKPGSGRGQFSMSDDFDTPLPEGETRPRDPDLDPQIIWQGATLRLSPEQIAQLTETGKLEIGAAQLVWRGKDQQDWSDLVVQAPPLYIQEKSTPR